MAESVDDLLQRRWLRAALVLGAAVPLLWPQVPPLVDLLGHMGRYRIEIAIDQSPALQRGFDFQWAIIGNLGVDLLIVPMAKLFGIGLGTKLIVLAIPPLTVLGMLWLAREAHGRVPATALFALPLAYSYPFHFGFINFSLAVALAFNAFALWLYLARTRRLRLRFWLFAGLAWLLWLTHTVGWGLFGLFAGGSEIVRRRQAGEAWIGAIAGTALGCAPLALPIVAMLLFRVESAEAASGDSFNWSLKWIWAISVLRDRWQIFDLTSAGLLYLGVLLLVGASIWRRESYFSWLVAVPALLCVAAFLLMPRIVTGSAYADMRLAPFALALAVLAIKGPRFVRSSLLVLMAGLIFFAARMGATTASFLLLDARYRDELRAVEAIRHGASVLSFVAMPCRSVWQADRLAHLPSMAIVRRDAFTNDQWSVDGAQLVTIRQPGVGAFDKDPSQMVYPRGCGPNRPVLENQIAAFDRSAFGYVWTIGTPVRALAPDLVPVWSNAGSALYRVEPFREEAR